MFEAVSCVFLHIGSFNDFNSVTALLHGVDGDTMRLSVKPRRMKRFAHDVSRQRDSEASREMSKRLGMFRRRRRAASTAPAGATDSTTTTTTTTATTATTTAADTSAAVTSAVVADGSATVRASAAETTLPAATGATSATSTPAVDEKRAREHDDDDDDLDDALPVPPSPQLPAGDERVAAYRKWIYETAQVKK